MAVSMAKIGSGAGYKYFTKQTVSGDYSRDTGSSLHKYYQATGTPPGVWVGSGVESLREVSSFGRTVTEQQMEFLYGYGIHPQSDVLHEQGQDKLCSLGRSYVKKDGSFFGVSGYDVTFTPPKSVSVLWGMGDEKVSDALWQAHWRAVEKSLEFFETQACYVRRGYEHHMERGSGFIAAAFHHYDNRFGEPNLHTHVAISNKTPTRDGKFLSLDGRAMHENIAQLSAYYNARLSLEISQLGLDQYARNMGEDKKPVIELAGIGQNVCEAASQRRKGIQARYDQLVTEFIDKYGVYPDKETQEKLNDQACLMERVDKDKPRSFEQCRHDWRAAYGEIIRSDRTAEQVRQQTSALLEPWSVKDPEGIADHIIGRLEKRRSTWKRSHLHNEIYSALSACQFENEHEFECAVELLTQCCERRLLCVRQADGVKETYENASVFSTERVLYNENKVLVAAGEDCQEFPINEDDTRQSIEQFNAQHSFDLSDDQEELLHTLASSSSRFVTAVGAAGAGKTAAMTAYANLIRSQGHQVIGLSTSAVAAEELGSSIGAEAFTLDSFRVHWDGHNTENLPVTIRPGDRLLIDEGGMVSTAHYAMMVDIAQATGAQIVAIGDPYQLDAVQSGGMMRALCDIRSERELDTVVRFGKDHEQAEASLSLRKGEESALDFYDTRGWLHQGTHTSILHQIVEDAYAHSYDQDVLMMAGTRADVTELNRLYQQKLCAHGQILATGQSCELMDGLRAYEGDVIMTRHNDNTIRTTAGERVKNGQSWIVSTIDQQGQIHAVSTQDETIRIVLPHWYAQQHTQLGYASTVHSAQGKTVGSSFSLVSDTATRQSIYVAATRGRNSNHLYAVTDPEHRYEHHQEASGLTARDIIADRLSSVGFVPTITETVRDAREENATVDARVERYVGWSYDQLREESSRLNQEYLGAYMNDEPTELIEEEMKVLSGYLREMSAEDSIGVQQKEAAMAQNSLEDDGYSYEL